MQSNLRRCEDKLLIDLPAELSNKLGWSDGDILNVELADDGLKITRAMTAFDHVMEIAREGMEEYREALEILAKS